ncbi:PAP2 superfamily protein [Noviherbaspirillum humi]|uniref:PAP2 superfamily protein n=1 Tax=Noviherbaspirillum humi TaxID=1688639 RepID=A0A239F9T9_9BURK|nr:phosphatase PAP2 family protein [Noviherbaspirillum humi]SNS53676.1 PAP2 superfamily protein [Noviherbaspirillum humi]
MNYHADAPADIWQTYLRWVGWISLAFFPAYPFCNWVTAQRENTLSLYLRQELNIPLVPEFIWIYLSMYLMFFAPPFFLGVSSLETLGKRLLAGTLLASASYLVFPSHLGFERIVPADPLYQAVFTGLFAVDKPHNMVPSLHVVFTSIIAFALIGATSSRTLKAGWMVWLLLIIASTLLVHQHHLLDCATGLLLASLLTRLIKKQNDSVMRVEWERRQPR